MFLFFQVCFLERKFFWVEKNIINKCFLDYFLNTYYSSYFHKINDYQVQIITKDINIYNVKMYENEAFQILENGLEVFDFSYFDMPDLIENSELSDLQDHYDIPSLEDNSVEEEIIDEEEVVIDEIIDEVVVDEIVQEEEFVKEEVVDEIVEEEVVLEEEVVDEVVVDEIVQEEEFVKEEIVVDEIVVDEIVEEEIVEEEK